jgi:AbrB family looped-hinge helix DNA binding protein
MYVMGPFGAIVRVQPRHQVTLPKEVRCDLDLKTGDKLMFTKTEDGGWRIRKNPASLLAFMDELRPKMAGKVSLDDVFRWRQEDDDDAWQS